MKMINKSIPYYLFFGGGLGVILIVYLFLKLEITKYEEVVILAIPGIIYSHSILTGFFIKRNSKKATLNLIINQGFQMISFKLIGYKYIVATGLYLFINLDLTRDTIFKFKIGINPIFEVGLRADENIIFLGINIIAIIVVLLYLKAKREEKIEQALKNV